MEFNIVNPKTRSELLSAIRRVNYFRFGAGYTDLILELKKQNERGITIIKLAQLKDKQFSSIEKNATDVRIGSLVTASQIVGDKFIEKNFPSLHQAANNLASSQIRHVATVGGNLCTASPSGDIACALVALKSTCEILSSKGKLRIIPTTEFFIGPRKTVLKKDEILRSVLIPMNEKGTLVHSGFIKIGTRRSMECAVVSLAFHIQTDKNGIIRHCGIAIGSVAPTICFITEAEYFLKGKNCTGIKSNEKEAFAQLVLNYASPISDIRATAWYRKEVLLNISKSIFENR